ncbi:MAG TPA: VOC family protein [Vicinamibacterales bacterium]|jgi:catechol 2,3-dioxygenase-like lactoylglutathione lyase family enzyme
MTKPIVALLGAALLTSLAAAAQTRSTPSARVPMPALAAPNAAGVAMGHYHFVVQDVAANARFWTTLGGVASKAGTVTIVRLTDVIIVLTQGQSSGVSDGSVLNHVAFRVPSLAALESKGLKIERAGPDLPGIGNARSPEGERVELFDSDATNVGFTPAAGFSDPVAERHNKPIAVSIASHHFHLYLPDEAAVAAAGAWYAKTFGGTPGKRWHYDAVDLPGINVNLGVAPRPVQPTKGRTLDHIGFEVTNLAAFAKKLEAMGVTLDEAYHKNADGIGEARLTDPWGTSIELTEGLRSF